MIKILSFFALLLCVYGNAQNLIAIPFDKAHWKVNEETTFETFQGKQTLVLNGKAQVKNLDFTTGILSVDVYANNKRSFAGLFFRQQNTNAEEVYMRMHKSGQVDAVQYTPTFNDELAWQLYPEYQAQVFFKHTGWNTLTLHVFDHSAEVYVNNEYVLSVENLRTNQKNGAFGLFALFRNRFANFKYSKQVPEQKPQKIVEPTQNKAIIKKWEVTKAMPYNEATFQLATFANETVQIVPTEPTGLLPISKYVKKSSKGNFEQNGEAFAIATTQVEVDEDTFKKFSFDYSDKIRVYVNGVLLFSGSNAFRAKGVQYMGHLSLYTNSLYIPLHKGTNTISCVVIDKANGWGLMGALE
ncbi:family 16 glycoside hydrolase [Neptunitalea lumnitzerae]|uniref:3-keto-alpha-glucoside-1,2-lyase/3-keto-2-hydroxy-glucal hydratase domain-containing protein n=1 Tax=Neptunitalea lumnitzerae TaxID=2965509 RepID=A0ABQ5MLQ3_9FLAO|nr:family 16 glycoside hydrolase [Neptunitalea sp. Y10]GLB50335.1 hypothetical protein Y10_27030 [Neptunitalea sp. Y10]